MTQGESFHLQAQFGAGGGSGANYGNASGGLSYRFIDLVPGVRLHSCHGLRVDSATPAIAATWGALKAHYR